MIEAVALTREPAQLGLPAVRFFPDLRDHREWPPVEARHRGLVERAAARARDYHSPWAGRVISVR